jgi:mannose-1-phosphate guanylyltransferase
MEPLAAKGEVVVAALDAGWSDVGSWSALWEIADKDAQGNVVAGQDKENFILQGTENCYVYGSKSNEGSGRLIATLGVENLVIVDTPDALLVANKDKVQDIKKIVAQIKASGRTQHHQHRMVYRPWGIYDSIDNGERYQVKRITVKPGAKLSVQMHHHRAEHWIVVSGTAKVTNGDKTFLVTENESTYIPIGQVHALENPGVLPLEMIEVQSGSYLGEDDIVRFEDKYGRA